MLSCIKHCIKNIWEKFQVSIYTVSSFEITTKNKIHFIKNWFCVNISLTTSFLHKFFFVFPDVFENNCEFLLSNHKCTKQFYISIKKMMKFKIEASFLM